MKKEHININLDAIDQNLNIKLSEIVHKDVYERLRKEVIRDLSQINESYKQPYSPGSGYIYFIDGTRGAGKSTFLQAVSKGLVEDIKTFDNSLHLETLAYIDPSRIEKSEIVLLNILKAIKDIVKKSEKQNNTQNLNSKRKNCLDQFKKIAAGLSLLAPTHTSLIDIDPELFLEWGLEQVQNSSTLRDNFHKLLDEVCSLIEVKSLVLCFDDADTNALNAISLLESIRKYLDTPRLLILVTGDMELYSQIVRDHFYNCLGHSTFSQDNERSAQRTKMIDHLEDQYLLKLFPIRRRIQLRPIWNLRNQDESLPFRLTSSYWEKDHQLRVFLIALIRKGLRIKSDADVLLVYEFILKQPLRSFLQLISSCAENFHIDKSDIKSVHGLIKSLSDALRAMSLGSLYKFNIDVDAIAAEELSALNEAVFDLTVRDGELDTGAYLRPQPSNTGLKSSYVSLSSEVVMMCSGKPNKLIQYMFGGPGSAAVYSQVLLRFGREIQKDADLEYRLKEQFKKYIGIGRKEDALNWAWHTTAILMMPYLANTKARAIDFGIVGLNKSSKKSAEKREFHKDKYTIKKAIEACNKSGKIPCHAFSLIDISGQSTRTFSSILNILGLIDRLLVIDLTQSTKHIEDQVTKTLARVENTLTITSPNWDGEFLRNDGESNYLDDIEQEEIYESKLVTQLARNITQWLLKTKDLRESILPSAILIGKIWTRIYFSLEKVSQTQRQKNASYPELMEFFALCLINSFLIEENEHHLISKSWINLLALDRSNPQTSIKIFLNKFNNEQIDHSRFPITFLISSCPLILGLLRDTDLPGNNGKTVSQKLYAPLVAKFASFGVTDELLCDQKAWDVLSKVLISGAD